MQEKKHFRGAVFVRFLGVSLSSPLSRSRSLVQAEPECTSQSFRPGWGDGSHLVRSLSPKNWESQLSTVSSNLLKSKSLKSRVRKRVRKKRLSVSEHLETQLLLFFLIIKTASNEKILRVNLLILTEHAEVIVLPTAFLKKKKKNP